MPPDISTSARPLIPTGRPPCPGMPPVKTNTSSLVDLNEHLGVRVAQVHAKAVRLLYAGADVRRELD